MIQTKLPYLPERTPKPRKSGITMVMDKGLSVRQAEDLVSKPGETISILLNWDLEQALSQTISLKKSKFTGMPASGFTWEVRSLRHSS